MISLHCTVVFPRVSFQDVNPVTGAVWTEAEKESPLDSMSDAEKEVHAHELMGLFHKMEQLGVVKPQLPK